MRCECRVKCEHEHEARVQSKMHKVGCILLSFFICMYMSHPGNLTKSNSDDLRSSPVSTPELRSNKSLYQESDIPLNH